MLRRPRNGMGLAKDPLWYKSGVIYEVHVRAFSDSNGDGTGDFPGLTSKLDYLKDLGITAIWLLPFYPSPLKDDGYDIADYCAVHSMYGSLHDFKTFLGEAHARGLRVITELVLNHTSDQHPWFQRARRAKAGSRWRNFYTWSQDPTRYKEARVIFKDVEKSNWTWDPIAEAYFWHRFFSHQPDLNYESPDVHVMMIRALDFWFDLGVDGLRLDAVPYLYEEEGTNCENLAQTHAFLRKLRQHVDEKYADRMLLAEANQWPEEAAAYFGKGSGDECHMAFHFPLMPRLFMLRMEDRLPITDILEQTPPIPERSQWALFLRNHDELTLEMVTDEERDYMYRTYASVLQARLNLGIRRRLAPLLGDDRKRIELLNALLFSLPGTPVLYYGDEIGLGENIYLGDRNGVRTPMQWSADRNAGFSRANPQCLYLPVILDPAYHYEANNVEVQLANPHSLLWWMRRMLALRKRWRALGEGKCEFLQPENRKVLTYLLTYGDETLLVVANLSRFVQGVELDLSRFEQKVPVELLGRVEFPAVTAKPYFLSLGPHGFYWFSLESKHQVGVNQIDGPIQVTTWQDIFENKLRPTVEVRIMSYVRQQTWFLSKGKVLRALGIKDRIPAQGFDDRPAWITVLQADFLEGDSENYLLPLQIATGAEAERIRQNTPGKIVAELRFNGPLNSDSGGVLYDAFAGPGLCAALLATIWHRRRLRGASGKLEGQREPTLRALVAQDKLPEPSPDRFEHQNSSVPYGDELIFKLFRRIEPGENPEVELGKYLTNRAFPNTPALAGFLEYHRADEPPAVVGVLRQFIPRCLNGQTYALDTLGRYYSRVITWQAQEKAQPESLVTQRKLLIKGIPSEAEERIGTFLETARLLGVRTAELHLALASPDFDDPFCTEVVTPHYLQSLYQSMRSQAVENFRQLRRSLKSYPPKVQSLVTRLLGLQPQILELYRRFSMRRLSAKRIRVHGDLALHQVLWTGKDFLFIDFEGDPSLPLTERRIKRSPLVDIASMLRSFDEVAHSGLNTEIQRGTIPEENVSRFETWVRYWSFWVGATFLNAYLPVMSRSELLPPNESEMEEMLRAFLLHEAISELGRHRLQAPGLLPIPLQAILSLVSDPSNSISSDVAPRPGGITPKTETQPISPPK